MQPRQQKTKLSERATQRGKPLLQLGPQNLSSRASSGRAAHIRERKLQRGRIQTADMGYFANPKPDHP